MGAFLALTLKENSRLLLIVRGDGMAHFADDFGDDNYGFRPGLGVADDERLGEFDNFTASAAIFAGRAFSPIDDGVFDPFYRHESHKVRTLFQVDFEPDFVGAGDLHGIGSRGAVTPLGQESGCDVFCWALTG